MHPNVARAIQEIDAAVFNGDTFEEPKARAELLEYIERWSKQLKSDEPEIPWPGDLESPHGGDE
jgi:hypothetical protein